MYIIRKNIFNKGNKLFDVDRGDAFVLTKLTMLRGKYISSAVQKEEKTKQNRNSLVIFDSQIYKMWIASLYI